MSEESIVAELAEVKQAVLTQTEKIGELVLVGRAQNNRIGKLETSDIKRVATEEERERWETKRERDFRWWYLFGLGLAGILSGVVFQVMEQL